MVHTLGPGLAVPLIQPDATAIPLHLTSHRQELSLNVPWASIKNVNGAFAAGAVPDGVGGGLNPYGPPLKITTLSELRKVQVISSAQLPSPVMITCKVPGVVTTIAFGVGFTSTVALIAVPVQPPAVGVIVKVTVTGALLVLVSVPLISPLPLAAIPVTVPVLSLVQL